MDNQNVVNFKIKNKFLLYILNILLKQENNVASLNEIIYLEILDLFQYQKLKLLPLIH